MLDRYTIQSQDVGRSLLKRDNRSIYVASAIGRILPCDIGKRVYLDTTTGHVSVENSAQRDARQGKVG